MWHVVFIRHVTRLDARHYSFMKLHECRGALMDSSDTHGYTLRIHVLQCVAVCCSVLHYSFMCCSVLQCVAVVIHVLQCVAVCCSSHSWMSVATVHECSTTLDTTLLSSVVQLTHSCSSMSVATHYSFMKLHECRGATWCMYSNLNIYIYLYEWVVSCSFMNE